MVAFFVKTVACYVFWDLFQVVEAFLKIYLCYAYIISAIIKYFLEFQSADKNAADIGIRNFAKPKAAQRQRCYT